MEDRMNTRRAVRPIEVEAEARARHVTNMYEEAEARLVFRDRVRVGIGMTLALAAFLFALWTLAGNGCGDLASANDLERGGGGAADRNGSGSAPSIAAAPAPDPEAFALQARMRAWRPTWAGSDAELAEVAVAVVQACRANPWPDPARCPDLMAVLVFRESSFRVGAIGARGEVGLAQLHGLALAGESPAAALDPDVNLRLALAWLRRSAMMCRIAGDDSVEAALSAYGSGRCRVYRGARMLLRWEAEIRSVDGGAS